MPSTFQFFLTFQEMHCVWLSNWIISRNPYRVIILVFVVSNFFFHFLPNFARQPRLRSQLLGNQNQSQQKVVPSRTCHPVMVSCITLLLPFGRGESIVGHSDVRAYTRVMASISHHKAELDWAKGRLDRPQSHTNDGRSLQGSG